MRPQAPCLLLLLFEMFEVNFLGRIPFLIFLDIFRFDFFVFFHFEFFVVFHLEFVMLNNEWDNIKKCARSKINLPKLSEIWRPGDPGYNLNKQTPYPDKTWLDSFYQYLKLEPCLAFSTSDVCKAQVNNCFTFCAIMQIFYIQM